MTFYQCCANLFKHFIPHVLDHFTVIIQFIVYFTALILPLDQLWIKSEQRKLVLAQLQSLLRWTVLTQHVISNQPFCFPRPKVYSCKLCKACDCLRSVIWMCPTVKILNSVLRPWGTMSFVDLKKKYGNPYSLCHWTSLWEITYLPCRVFCRFNALHLPLLYQPCPSRLKNL